MVMNLQSLVTTQKNDIPCVQKGLVWFSNLWLVLDLNILITRTCDNDNGSCTALASMQVHQAFKLTKFQCQAFWSEVRPPKNLTTERPWWDHGAKTNLEAVEASPLAPTNGFRHLSLAPGGSLRDGCLGIYNLWPWNTMKLWSCLG